MDSGCGRDCISLTKVGSIVITLSRRAGASYKRLAHTSIEAALVEGTTISSLGEIAMETCPVVFSRSSPWGDLGVVRVDCLVQVD